jgi:hypothetical protein
MSRVVLMGRVLSGIFVIGMTAMMETTWVSWGGGVGGYQVV